MRGLPLSHKNRSYINGKVSYNREECTCLFVRNLSTTHPKKAPKYRPNRSRLNRSNPNCLLRLVRCQTSVDRAALDVACHIEFAFTCPRMTCLKSPAALLFFPSPKTSRSKNETEKGVCFEERVF